MKQMVGEPVPAGWRTADPEEVGISVRRLEAVRRWQEESSGDRPYRLVVVRGGSLVAEWNRGIARESLIHLRSATKSVLSTLLGIAVGEGAVRSADDLLVDYFPQALEVPPGEGPKPGQYAAAKDESIRLRQLVSQTSGYLKPDEPSGKVFHYQTYGFVALSHVLAAVYDLHTPKLFPDLTKLMDEKLRKPMGATWKYYRDGFKFPPPARQEIFGRLLYIESTALDMARLGWLWRNEGKWADIQLLPRDWIREATRTAPEIRQNCPEEDWRYGFGFWTNDYGMMWPSLPRDSFAAWGAGSQHIWVCPSLDLVVVQSPGVWDDQRDNDQGLLLRVLDCLS